MTICPKCRSTRIGGPIYNKRRDVLVYVCRRCGYTEDATPADAEKKS